MPSAVNTYGKINFDGNINTSRLTTSGIMLNLDAGNPKSFPGTPSGVPNTRGWSGNWFDLSPTGAHFYLLGGVTYESNPPCFTFDGIDDRSFDTTAYNLSTSIASIRDTFFPTSTGGPTNKLSLTPAQDRTIEIWFRLNNTLNQYAGLFAHALNQSGCLMYPGTLGDLGKFVWTWDDSLQNGAALTNKAVQVGEWIQLVVVLRNSYYFTYYVNGQLDKAEQRTTDLATATNNPYFTIASDARFGYRLACSVSIIRMYNRMLTAQEILNNYNVNKGRFGLR